MYVTNTEQSLNKIFDIEMPSNDESTTDITLPESSDIIINEPVSHDELVNPEPTEEDIQEAEATEIRDDAQEDYSLARDNLKRLLSDGEDLLDSAIRIATSTEDPKAIAAANNVLQGLVGINRSLMDLSQKRQDIVNKSRLKDLISRNLNTNSQGTGEVHTNIQNVTTNVQFVGTSNDLMELIKRTKEGLN